ncbi:MAG: acyl-CoA desaturase [Pseudobdellovibrionaceae bacterium]
MNVSSVTRSNTAIFPLLQIASTSFVFYALFQNYSWKLWLTAYLVYFLNGCFGVTITFHRLLSHRSFKIHKYLEYLFSFLGAMGGTGSSIGWVAVHKQHHRYADKTKDPHSPHQSGLKILFSHYVTDFNKWPVRRLITDRFHLFLHNYYHAILFTWAIFWLSLGFEFFIFCFAVPMAIQLWASNLSNWGNHLVGYRNFETVEKSTNCWWLALITWGEGWHNNHHKFPNRWSFRVRWWEFDPSAVVIAFLRSRS